ncbi:MAG: hypothetical protein ACXV97_04100, partial [Chthoniobacterales bacterium]
QSANYSVNGNAVGEFAAGQTAIVTSGSYANKSGFVGELYEIVALSITASSNNLNETASRQLNAAPMADDSTTFAALDPSTISWSIVSGPLASISLSGIATAGNVYQDTDASAGGTAQSLSGQLNLTILNVGTDDFGAYAGDQIDDSWQVQYFGQPPNPLAGPNVDADGTGQTNLFKFVAGLNPLDGSRFTLSIQPMSGQPAQKNLVFQPLVSGRTYNVQFRTNLTSGSWGALTGTTQSDNGNQRTVTDLNASGAPKYYQVQISRP